jgi:hypothetical protein
LHSGVLFFDEREISTEPMILGGEKAGERGSVYTVRLPAGATS